MRLIRVAIALMLLAGMCFAQGSPINSERSETDDGTVAPPPSGGWPAGYAPPDAPRTGCAGLTPAQWSALGQFMEQQRNEQRLNTLERQRSMQPLYRIPSGVR